MKTISGKNQENLQDLEAEKRFLRLAHKPARRPQLLKLLNKLGLLESFLWSAEERRLSDMTDKNFDFDAVTVAITEILKEMGMPASLRGYDYTRYGIKLVLEDKTLVSHRVTTALYPAIAERFDTTASRVEKCIRYAIEATCDRISPRLLEKYFGNTIRCDKDGPTNRQFLAVLADCVPLALAGEPTRQTNQITLSDLKPAGICVFGSSGGKEDVCNGNPH